jgi:23S rRNA (pseudouridine1915-N3)-methyltransferase
MLFEFVFTGKTADRFLAEGIGYYKKKLDYYTASGIKIISCSKEKTMERILRDESQRILKSVSNKDYLILLDEKGKQFSSIEFANEIQKIQNKSVSKIMFVTGSAYGVDSSLRERANLIISFSKFTFTHQMIRMLLLEQAYRAMTILKREKYHH